MLGSVLPVLLATAWTPGYDSRRETVSRLASAGQPYATPVRVATVVAGVGVLAAAGRAASRVRTGRRLVRALVTIAGAATVVAGVFPKAPPAVAGSTASAVHVAAAVTAGAGLVAAMALVAVRGTGRRDRRTSALAATVSAAAGAAFPFLWGTLVYGVLERVVVVTAGAWVLAAGSGRSQR